MLNDGSANLFSGMLNIFGLKVLNGKLLVIRSSNKQNNEPRKLLNLDLNCTSAAALIMVLRQAMVQ